MIFIEEAKVNKCSPKVQDRIDHAFQLCVEFLDDLHDEITVTVTVDNSVKRAGCVKFDRRNNTEMTLSLSKHFLELAPDEFVEDTIRHEIAHILAGRENKHNRVWKQRAVECGAKPETCHSMILVHKMRYIEKCEVCGKIIRYIARKKTTDVITQHVSCRVPFVVVDNPEYGDKPVILLGGERIMG